jgi:hypothetical protein
MPDAFVSAAFTGGVCCAHTHHSKMYCQCAQISSYGRLQEDIIVWSFMSNTHHSISILRRSSTTSHTTDFVFLSSWEEGQKTLQAQQVLRSLAQEEEEDEEEEQQQQVVVGPP